MKVMVILTVATLCIIVGSTRRGCISFDSSNGVSRQIFYASFDACCLPHPNTPEIRLFPTSLWYVE